MRLPIALTAIALSVNVAMAEGESTSEVDVTSMSYGMGVLIKERLLTGFDDIDLDALVEGLRDASDGKPLKVDAMTAAQLMQTYQTNKQAEAAETQAAEGQAYLAQNAEKDGIKVTDSGLQYEVITEGTGAQPAATDQVTVHYKGTLINGDEFDSSYSRGEPTSFALNQVIPGWTEGLQLMKEGAKYRFTIPSDLAYGANGAGPMIGPNETLIFEVELIKVGQ
ncbi:MAG: FKBP-type peptidyl-prolyl cis-trans isomerase [Gammaproteobacteria bacterium]|nr:FKBP-type peptidyl-prolyl cis-trans isomerase [Gammaproteobacteria bacterium]